jgi:hypothetical protein
MMPKTYQLASLITLAILIPTLFLGYTYFADAQAIQQIRAEVYSFNPDSNIDFDLPERKINLNFTLNVTNPSSRDIQDISSTFNIYIEENFIGEGSFSNLSIKANSSKFKDITVSFDLKGFAYSIIDGIANALKNQNTEITIEGTMTASVLFGLTTASHSYTATSA